MVEIPTNLAAGAPDIKGAYHVLYANRPVWPAPGAPRQEGNPPDLYYWYFATVAMGRKRMTEWKYWKKSLRMALLTHQETRFDLKGSWTPPGRWGKLGGRVMTTALGALCLELVEELPTAFR